MRTPSLAIDNRELIELPLVSPRLTILAGRPVLPPRTGLNHKDDSPMTAVHNLSEMVYATDRYPSHHQMNLHSQLVVMLHLITTGKAAQYPRPLNLRPVSLAILMAVA